MNENTSNETDQEEPEATETTAVAKRETIGGKIDRLLGRLTAAGKRPITDGLNSAAEGFTDLVDSVLDVVDPPDDKKKPKGD